MNEEINAFLKGFFYALGVDFAQKNDQNLTAKQFIINTLIAMDDKPWDESKVHRDKWGQFASEGHSRVETTVHAFKTEGDNKYAEGGEPKDRYFNSLPKLNVTDAKKVNEALKPFAKEKLLEGKTVSKVDPKKLIVRGARRYEGKRRKGEPEFVWEQNGKPLDEKRAMELENACKTLGWSNAISAQTKNVKIRPDFAVFDGQSVTGKLKGNKPFSCYPPETQYKTELAKHQKTVTLLAKRDELVKEIAKDIKAGKPEAVLAYFTHQTVARIGSKLAKENPSYGGSTMLPEHFKVDEQGNLTCKFKAKNGWWILDIKDQYLKKTIIEKLKTAEAGKPLFGVSYDKFGKYLKELSARIGLDEDNTWEAHDFRRVTATQKAGDYVAEAIKQDKSILKDDKRYMRVCAEAVNYAANALGDTSDIVFSTYISPQVLFKHRPKLANAYLRMFAGV